jgi:hypothetical protein
MTKIELKSNWQPNYFHFENGHFDETGKWGDAFFVGNGGMHF